MTAARVLWRPTQRQVDDSRTVGFLTYLAEHAGVRLNDFAELYEYSIERMGDFWAHLWDFAGLVGDKGQGPYLLNPEPMQDAVWFPDARINLAENLLGQDGDEPAIIGYLEDGRRTELSRTRYRHESFRCMAALANLGVTAGDRVAGYLPNTAETVVAATATLGLGAVWASCSTDLAAPAVAQRLSRVQPSVLLVADTVQHRGQRRSFLEDACVIADQVPSIRRIVVVGYDASSRLPADPRMVTWQSWLAPHPGAPRHLERVEFDHPSYILFTSGTSGPAKCIVHRTGGVLLKHASDYVLHSDFRPGDSMFRATSTGWVTWNYQVSALAFGGCLVLYDGHPFHPGPERLLDILAEERITHWGTSPHVLERWAREGLAPCRTHDLSALRYVSAGGSLLTPQMYRYVYSNIKRDLHLVSPSGGTEILSVFSGGNPIGPCVEGEIQSRGLGMKVEVYDDDGNPVVDEPGELVCSGPFPTMPLGFWGEPRARFEEEYFSTYPGVWKHNDRARVTPRGGVQMLGRSDATLNVNGVRIGVAEVYEQLRTIEQVESSAAIEVPTATGSIMVLFVSLRRGTPWEPGLEQMIRERLRRNCSPRHVPHAILRVPDLPRTPNGKISERVIKAVVSDPHAQPSDVLVNPDSVDFFRHLAFASE